MLPSISRRLRSWSLTIDDDLMVDETDGDRRRSFSDRLVEQELKPNNVIKCSGTGYENPMFDITPKCNGSRVSEKPDIVVHLPDNMEQTLQNIHNYTEANDVIAIEESNNINNNSAANNNNNNSNKNINNNNNNTNNNVNVINNVNNNAANLQLFSQTVLVNNVIKTELVKNRANTTPESLVVDLDSNNNSNNKSTDRNEPLSVIGLSPSNDLHRKSRSYSAFSGLSGYTPRRKSTLLRDESPYKALRELIIPCLIAGFGNVATGVIFAHVQSWSVFENVPQLNILVPALLGLKGNVEMTLASRLSTHANLGDLDDPGARKKLITCNMALVQTQASTVGFVAPLLALAVSYIWPSEGSDLTIHEAILLISGSVLTANIANMFLGSLMCGIIVLSKRLKINPDNIATPIAASFGDLTTMALLAYISHYLFLIIHIPWIQIVILASIMSVIPFLVMIARKIAVTRKLLITGWFPICGAMILQITGGKIMENSLDQFTRLAAFQPVINGVGGNLAAVQTSRISTYLHRRTAKKQLPDPDNEVCTYPGRVFFNLDSDHAIMARFLLFLSIPSHLLFIFVIKLVRGHFAMTFTFLTVYMVAAVTQVAVLIQVSYTLVHALWKKGFNPDNSALPFLTALGDLIGSVLLALAFFFLLTLGDVNAQTTIPVPPSHTFRRITTTTIKTSTPNISSTLFTTSSGLL